jgi:biotin carboxyl carrier protein
VADGPERLVEVSRPEALVMNLLMDGRSVEAGAVPQGDGYLIDVDGVNHEVSVVDPRKAALRAGAADGAAAVRTQMPGRVVRVLVEAGAAVSKGQPLVVVEAMKMENELKAPRDGVVARLLVSAGDLVEGKATLIELA